MTNFDVEFTPRLGEYVTTMLVDGHMRSVSANRMRNLQVGDDVTEMLSMNALAPDVPHDVATATTALWLRRMLGTMDYASMSNHDFNSALSRALEIHAVVRTAHENDVSRREQVWTVLGTATELSADARMTTARFIICDACHEAASYLAAEAGWSCHRDDMDARVTEVRQMITSAVTDDRTDELLAVAKNPYQVVPPTWVPDSMVMTGGMGDGPPRLVKTVRACVLALFE